jgi:formylglycine-generating enzyme
VALAAAFLAAVGALAAVAWWQERRHGADPEAAALPWVAEGTPSNAVMSGGDPMVLVPGGVYAVGSGRLAGRRDAPRR